MRPGARLTQLLRDTGGNVLILSAFGMTALVGAAGMATDTIQWTLWKRQLQRSADSAALAGALVNMQGGSATGAATTEIGRYTSIGLFQTSATPTIEVSPTSGPFAGDARAVRVVVETSQTLPFSSFFMRTTPVIRAEATAAAISFGDYCVRSLEPGTSTGIILQGSAVVNLGCGMHTNSQGSPAVTAGGSSTVTASPVSAVGAIPSSASYAAGTVLQPYSLRQSDPLSGLPEPVVPNTCSNRINVGPNGTAQVNPGCYRGIDIQGTVTFQPGTYIIDGDFDLGSQANVSGSGVTFILTSSQATTNPSLIGNVTINGGAHLDLTAQETGTYAGVLFYQDRRAPDAGGNANIINGNASSILRGSVYMPSQQVNFLGTSGMTTTCFYLIARRVQFSGNSAIDNVCNVNWGMPDLTGVQVRLVN
ncbi:MAG: pilus assembly protein TadG-related protein [Pseudomonadota bacterium]